MWICCFRWKKRQRVGEKAHDAVVTEKGRAPVEERRKEIFEGSDSLRSSTKGCQRFWSSRIAIDGQLEIDDGTDGTEKRRAKTSVDTIQRNWAGLEEAAMSLLPRLRRHRRATKKSSSRPNPYASRGLEQFASLCAELTAKREMLAAQIGAPVPLVRFTSGSQRTWKPIFIAKRKEMSTDAPQQAADEGGSSFDQAVAAASMLLPEDAPGEASHEAVPTASVAFGALESASTDGGREQADAAAVQNGMILAKNLAWPQIATTATFVAATTGALKVGKVSSIAVTMSVALACSVLLRKRYGQGSSPDKNGSLQAAESEARKASLQLFAGEQRLERATDSIEALPSPPAMVYHQAPVLEDESAAACVGRTTSPATPLASSHRDHKQQRSRFNSQFKPKHFRKEEPFTAPSSPKASTNEASFSSTPNTPVKRERTVSSLRPFAAPDEVHVSIVGGKSLVEKRLSRRGTQQDSRRSKSMLRGTSSFRREQQSVQIATAVGLLVVLGGLLAGRVVAIFFLLCWWYSVPKLRQHARERSLAREFSEGGERSLKRGSKTSNMADLNSRDYRKKVIMEGLLDRGRKSTS